MPDLFPIIYEDNDLLVINKPAGLVCHPTKGDVYSSLISRVRLYLNSATHDAPPNTNRLSTSDSGPSPILNSPSSRRRPPSTINDQPSADSAPHLVNRLDRETSGVTIVAKSALVAGELGRLWETRSVKKEYLAIVHGHVRDDHGVIDAPLGKDDRSRVAIKDCVRSDGTPAQTEFSVIRRFARNLSAINSQPSTEPFSLLRVAPRTGRKHQLRIHLAHLGHPIVGDKIYGGDEDAYLALVENRLTAEQRQRLILPHHALHAAIVSFRRQDRDLIFRAEPEAWFADFHA